MDTEENGAPDWIRTSDSDLVLRPARLRSKGAAAALLAVQAMTDGNPNGVAFTLRLELAAATRCSAWFHDADLQTLAVSVSSVHLLANPLRDGANFVTVGS